MQYSQTFFIKHKKLLAFTFFTTFASLNAWVSSISLVADHQKNNASFASWEPYAWEFSSLFMLLVLIPYIALINKKYPLKYGRFKFNLMVHFFHTTVFSLIHSVGMIWIRKLIYQINETSYDFGHWPTELFYEYRKDVLTYFIVLALIYIYGLVINQIEGIASLITEDDKQSLEHKVDKLLIKKKGREYIIDLAEVSTIEAGGNYIYIHANKHVYPMRETMTNILKRLDKKQFIQVHRSFIVNIEFTKEIISSESSDFSIKLINNRSVPLSRKYRSAFKKLFEYEK